MIVKRQVKNESHDSGRNGQPPLKKAGNIRMSVVVSFYQLGAVKISKSISTEMDQGKENRQKTEGKRSKR